MNKNSALHKSEKTFKSLLRNRYFLLMLAAITGIAISIALSEYLAAESMWRAWGIMGVGLAFTGLLTAYILLVMKRTEQTRQFAEQILKSKEAVEQEMTARMRTEETLRASEEKFRQIFEHAPIGMIIAGEDNKILKANKAFSDSLQYAEEELIGRSIEDLTYADDRGKSIDLSRRLLKGEISRFQPEKRYVKKNGEILWVGITAAEIHSPDDKTIYSLSIINDITERKQRERELEAIFTLSVALRSASTRAEQLPIILDHVSDLLNVEGASLSMLDPATNETIVGLGRRGWEKWTGLRLPSGEGVIGHVISTGQTYTSNDVLSDPHLIRPDLIKNLRAIACVPLIAEKQTIGALVIGCRTNIRKEEIQLLKAIGEIAAIAIHRVTLHEQAVQHVQRLSALHEIDIAISSSLDLRISLSVLLGHVIKELGVDAAAVLTLNPHSQTLSYAAGHGFRARDIEQTKIKLGEGHVGRAALDRQTVSIPNAAESKDTCTHIQTLKGEAFISHHVAPLIAKGQVKGVLELFNRSPLVPNAAWLDFFEALAGQAAIAIDNASLFNDLQRANDELVLAYDATIEGWAKALDLRDKETEGHSRRVTDMTVRMARSLGVSEADLVHMRRGALLHDIGKVGIPDHILLKPGPLTDEEWGIMRKHPVLAYDLLSPIAFLHPALEIPFYHHEKWDGSGYPQGLKGNQIPLAARIFAVVDVWDALDSDRPYRPAWPKEKMLKYLTEQTGKHFHPEIVETFVTLLND